VTPGAAKWIFAIICYVGAGIQGLGFIAVSKVSKSSAFRSPGWCFKRRAGETRFIQTISVPRLDHYHCWVFNIRRLGHHLCHSTLQGPNQLPNRILLYINRQQRRLTLRIIGHRLQYFLMGRGRDYGRPCDCPCDYAGTLIAPASPDHCPIKSPLRTAIHADCGIIIQ
jgi:hypothetical protein